MRRGTCHCAKRRCGNIAPDFCPPPCAGARLARALLLLCLLAAPAMAQPPGGPVEFTRINIGFAGRYKVGYWTPVRLTLKLGALPEGVASLRGHVSLAVADGDGATNRVRTEQPIQLSPGAGTQTVVLYAKFGGVDNVVEATFHPEGGRPISRRFDGAEIGDERHVPWAMLSAQELIVNVGSSAGFEAAAQLNRSDDGESIAVARLDDTRSLPTRWYGYEGVDTLALTTSRPEVYDTLNAAQVEAIRHWLELGGRLILFAGDEAPRMLDPQEPLAGFAPGSFQNKDMITLSRTGELEEYAEADADPLLLAGDLRVPKLADVRGKVEVRQGEAALVIRSPFGFGEVVFVGADFDRGAFVRWRSRGQFLNKLLGKPAAGVKRVSDDDPGGRLSHSGLTDLSGQLRGALDQFAGIRLVPFYVVALLVLGYIVLIGPVDYFVVKRLFGRMEYTWITFPLIVVAVSYGAYVLAYRMKGDQLRVNQVDLVDVDLDRNLVRGTSWMNVFSPRVDDYDVTGVPRFASGAAPQNTETLTSWMGLPGSALGGMNQSSSPGGVFQNSYRYSPDLDRMLGVPIQVWSTKCFTSRWSANAPGRVDVKLSLGPDGLPSGTITNGLDVPLRDCMLAYDHWAFSLGDVAAGGVVTIDSGTPRRELSDELTGRRLEYDKQSKQYRNYTTNYNQSSFDVPAILQQMMFFEASGGIGYVQLANRYQHFTDLSNHLRLWPRRVSGIHRFAGPGIAAQQQDRSPAPKRQTLDLPPLCVRREKAIKRRR